MPMPDSETVLLIPRYGMGNAEPDLQLKVMSTYLKLLDENNLLPAIICFYTEGVKLTVEGSPVLDVLQSLEAKGVRIIVCVNCLTYYDLSDKFRVGIECGLTDIIEAQWHASKVLSL
ncbi:MAG TPA: sulfurtransferase-like selenium metabolism protein YedF [Anaerolineaceae bacterium]|nr:sulfurtransferase-like selenium metabolism protein YedF [Anaerolineaceae bacterium]